MSALDQAFILRLLTRAVDQEDIAHAFLKIADRFRAPAKVLVFGGVLRNAVLSAILDKHFPVRDLDLVVFGLANDEELHDILASECPKRNSFGGLKMIVQNFTVDVWRAELGHRIAGAPPTVTDPGTFLHCVTLTTDAILYDPLRATLYEQQFLRAMRQRTIDVGRDSRWLDPWVPFHLAHLAYVRELTNFQISTRISARLRESASDAVIEQAIHYLESKRHWDRARETVLSLVHEAGHDE